MVHGGEKLKAQCLTGTGPLCTGDAFRHRQDCQFAISDCLLSASKPMPLLWRIQAVADVQGLVSRREAEAHLLLANGPRD